MSRTFLGRYLRRPVGALFVAGVACGLLAAVLRALGEGERAGGAGFALVVVLVVQHVYWMWVPELPAAGAHRRGAGEES